MSSEPNPIPEWNNIAVASPIPLGYLAVPENVPHYYDGNIPSDVIPGYYQLQVVAVGYDAQGNIPDDPPIQYQSPLYHRAKPFVPPDPTAYQPRIELTPDGLVASAGWAPPGTTWLRPIGPGQGAVRMEATNWCWVELGGTISQNPPPPAGTPTLSAYIGQAIAAVDALKRFTQIQS